MNTKDNPDEVSKMVKSLTEEIARLRQDIDESYYRIPKQEFENVTIKKITQEVSEQINKRVSVWRNWIGFVFILLSFLGITQFPKLIDDIREDMREELKSDLENNMEQITDEIEDRLDRQVSTIQVEQERLKENQADALDRMASLMEEKAKIAASNETELQISNIRNDILLAQKTSLKTELNILKKDVESGSKLYVEALRDLEPLLKKAKETQDKALVSEFLDELFRLHFQSVKWEEIDKLRIKYEKDYELYPETWANIAISDMFLYEERNSLNYRRRAIQACEKSLESLPDYGIPYAVRLIIHMIDHERNNDNQGKEKETALKLIETINKGSVPVTSYETYEYLDRIKSISDKLKIFVEQLESTFPEAMERMESRYYEYLALKSNPQTLD